MSLEKGTIGGIFGKKIRKSIDSKDQVRLCFHEKKSEKTTKKFCCRLCLSKGFSARLKILYM